MADQITPADAGPLPTATVDAAMAFALDTLKRMPKGDPEVTEAYVTGVLIVFWGALWGTFGADYARGFIEAQLRGMEPDVPHDRFAPPKEH
jgi:hypothetical protein